MKKYYSIRVVTADSVCQAVRTIQIGEFEESDPLCDKVLTADELIEALGKQDEFFTICGYWKNDCGQIIDNMVCSNEFNEDQHEEIDDQIFFYGLTESKIKYAIEHVRDTEYEFVITSYEKLN